MGERTQHTTLLYYMNGIAGVFCVRALRARQLELLEAGGIPGSAPQCCVAVVVVVVVVPCIIASHSRRRAIATTADAAGCRASKCILYIYLNKQYIVYTQNLGQAISGMKSGPRYVSRSWIRWIFYYFYYYYYCYYSSIHVTNGCNGGFQEHEKRRR